MIYVERETGYVHVLCPICGEEPPICPHEDEPADSRPAPRKSETAHHPAGHPGSTTTAGADAEGAPPQPRHGGR